MTAEVMSVRVASRCVADRHTPLERLLHWINVVSLTVLIEILESFDHIAVGRSAMGKDQAPSLLRGLESAARTL